MIQASEQGAGKTNESGSDSASLTPTPADLTTQASTLPNARVGELQTVLQDPGSGNSGRLPCNYRHDVPETATAGLARRAEIDLAVRSLVRGLAHEARNPLFALSATLDAFEACYGGRSEYQEYLSELHTQVDRLSILIEALVEYVRPLDFDRTPQSFDGALADAVTACAPLAQSSNVQLRLESKARLPRLAMDRPNLVRVLRNVLENAIQYSAANGSVSASAETLSKDSGVWVQCQIQDSGPGFRSQDLAKIFEPFFSRRRGGIGLGLTSSQRIVEAHGGVISASNLESGGGVITILLPAPAPERSPKEDLDG